MDSSSNSQSASANASPFPELLTTLHRTGFTDSILLLGKDTCDQAQTLVDALVNKGGGLCIILPSAPKGFVFEGQISGVAVLDLRYGTRPSLIFGNHPRLRGIWPQYTNLSTGLSRNVIISDVLTDKSPVENWKGEESQPTNVKYGGDLSSENYRHSHNHYQNLLAEVFNFSSQINAVAVWGDSGAFAPNAKSWGGFFSARSWPLKWSGITPTDIPDYKESDFDAALVGLEVNVLNAGKPSGCKSDILPTKLPKTGVQIVGFGSRNTAAIELRTEDSDDLSLTPEQRKGTWDFGILAWNALHPGSTLCRCDSGTISIGLDFRNTKCTNGALLIRPEGAHTGIRFDNDSGEIYADETGATTIKAGHQGIRVDLPNNEYIRFDSKGTLTMSQGIIDQFRRLICAAMVTSRDPASDQRPSEK